MQIEKLQQPDSPLHTSEEEVQRQLKAVGLHQVTVCTSRLCMSIAKTAAAAAPDVSRLKSSSALYAAAL